MILGVMGEAGIDETQIKEKALALMHQAEEPVPLDRAQNAEDTTNRFRRRTGGQRAGCRWWVPKSH